MTGPPGHVPTLSLRRINERRDHQTETLLRYANHVLDAAGIARSQSWVVRTVRAYRPGCGLFGGWLVERLDLTGSQRREIEAREGLTYALSYLDPTGELAVKHVMARR